MARTKMDVPVEVRCGYSSVIVFCRNGIDSTNSGNKVPDRGQS